MATFDVGILFTAVNNTKGAFRSLNKDLEKTKKTSRSAVNGLRAIQVVLAGIAVGAAVQFSKAIIKNVADMELLVERLARVEGGYGAARKTLADLTKQYGRTPFAIDAMANSFTRLRAAGLSAADANRTLAAGADAVAAFGGTTTELNRYIIGLQQSIGKGTLSMEELRQQIGEAVPSAMRVLAREMDISIGELFSRIEKGAVNSKEAIRLLTQGLEEDFAGAAAAAGNKITGALQGMQSSIRVTLEEAFNINTNAGFRTVELIETVSASLQNLIKSFDQQDVDNIFFLLNNIVGALEGGSTVVGPFATAITELVNGISSVIGRTVKLVEASVGIFIPLNESMDDSATAAESWGIRMTRSLIDVLTVGGTYIGRFSSMFRGLEEFYNKDGKKFEEALVKALAGASIEDAIKKITAWKKSLEDVTVTQKIAGGGFEITAKGLAKVNEILKQLEQRKGNYFDVIAASQDKMKKAMKATNDYVDRAFSRMAEKLETLNKRVKTTTFTFGSQTAAKMKQQLEEFLPFIETLKEKLAAVPKEGLSGQNLKDYETGVKSLNHALRLYQEISAAIASGEGKALDDYMVNIGYSVEKARISVERFGGQLEGEYGRALISLKGKYESINLSIEKVIKKAEKAHGPGAQAAVKALRDLQDQLNGILKERVDILGKEKALQNEITRIASQRAINDINKQTKDLQRQMNPLGGLLGKDPVEEKKYELDQNRLRVLEEIDKLKLKASKEGDPLGTIQAEIEAYERLSKVQIEAIKNTTAAGLAAATLWESVGKAIDNSVKGAMKDLIKGTLDAKQVLLSFYDAITDAVIEYIYALIKAYIRQQLINAVAGGIGIPAFGSGGVVGGGLVPSQAPLNTMGNTPIFPMASGGIIGGPTLFGMALAGEAGPEAIMPLTRIGGDLGVKTTGGGGDQYSITISAIDTQSGASFLMKHSDQIVSQMRHQTRLNNGMGVK